MVWKSWGAALPPAIALLLAVAPLCSGAADVAVSFSSAPRRVSRSPSAAFAFRVTQTGGGGGGPCGDCTVTCQLDGGRASDCGNSGRGGNGTETVSYAGLEDGNHSLAVCASRGRGGGRPPSSGPTCATYAWDVG